MYYRILAPLQHPFWCILTYQGNDNFTVRVCLEVVLGVKALPQKTVVVDFAIDGEGEAAVLVDEGLGTGV
jgi:hypothetical protein